MVPNIWGRVKNARNQLPGFYQDPSTKTGSTLKQDREEGGGGEEEEEEEEEEWELGISTVQRSYQT